MQRTLESDGFEQKWQVALRIGGVGERLPSLNLQSKIALPQMETA
jgi:hypothetical protein